MAEAKDTYRKLQENSIRNQDIRNDIHKIENILFELKHTSRTDLENLKKKHPTNYLFRTYNELNEKYDYEFDEPQTHLLGKRYFEMHYLLIGRCMKNLTERNAIINQL